MRKALVITNYTDETDNNLCRKSVSVITGCTNNINYDFTQNELKNLVRALKDFVHKLSVAKTGNKAQKTLKREAKKVLAFALKVVCRDINRQHRHEESILLTSGAMLHKNSNVRKKGPFPDIQCLSAKVGLTAYELNIRVKKIKGLNNHGTAFAYTELLNADDDISKWKRENSTCHSITISGLKKGTFYLVSAAYQGAKGTTHNWSKPIIIATKPG